MAPNSRESRRRTRSRLARLAVAAGFAALCGCASLNPWGPGRSESSRTRARNGSADEAIYRRAQRERASYLEQQVARLRADLRQAEDTMVAIESGLRGVHTRADAVSALAEARISVERATKSVTWRPKQVREARRKLEEAERQFQAGHSGSAVFFASRAKRIAETLNEEASQVESSENARFVKVRRINLRVGPNGEARILGVLTGSTPVFPERTKGKWVLVRTSAGQIGWVHASLLRER